MKGIKSVENQPLYSTWKWIIRAYTAKKMVCERWLDFKNFVEDVKEYPGMDFKFHRHYGDKPYGPGNFRWRHRYVSTSETREKRKLYMREWTKNKRKIDPDYERNFSLRKTFGIGIDEYRKILERQNGCCAICKGQEKSIAHTSGEIRKLTVDHCHKIGKIRGILCSRCNRGLGFFQDDIENLKSAISYLGGNIK